MIIVNPTTLQAQQFAGGTGTQGDPYLVATAYQLNAVREFPFAHYRQTADIDLNVAPYNTGSGWEPISGFTGSYDGGGFAITGLVINRAATNNVGLFGDLNGVNISNLRLTGATVTGNNNVGVLAGFVSGSSTITGLILDNIMVVGSNYAGGMIGNLASDSVIRDSYSSGGGVQSPNSGVTGGLVGEADRSAITSSYSSGMNITSGNNVGGLVGYADHANISNSYAINRVTGANAGGLVGVSQGGSISSSYSASVATGSSASAIIGFNSGSGIYNSYFNSDSTASGSGIGLTTTQMRQRVSFSGWDFTNMWLMLNEGGAFPVLKAPLFAGGSGTLGDPYLVATNVHLNNVRLSPGAHYRQTTNINLNAPPYNTGSGWEPIIGFTGSYDGGGFTISGLVINRTTTNNVGLFGTITGGSVANLGLVQASVSGNTRVGALAGYLTAGSMIHESYSTAGTVQASSLAGGLVGEALSSSITTSYSTGMKITSVTDLGGLAGEVDNSTITNSYAISSVTGDYAGGLVGVSDGGSITTSYSSSIVSGGRVGGLTGIDFGTTFTDSYYNSDFVASGNAHGTGLTTTRMRQLGSYIGFDFPGTWLLHGRSAFPELRAFVQVSTLFAGGSGTQSDPYQVATAIHLYNTRNATTAHYRQTGDIDLNVDPYNTGSGWEPIAGFTGSYDGGGHTIANLYTNHPDRVKSGGLEAVGLFGSVSGATLSHLALTHVSVTGYNNVGALVGSATGETIISRMTLTGGTVSGNSTVGGLAGYSEAVISEAAATGIQIIGGSFGQMIGGLVGHATSSITNSYSINRVTANAGVGGMVGQLSGSITSSYSASVVTSNSPGTLVGSTSSGTITNSYYNSDSTGTGWIEGTGLTTAQMRQRSSFPGFDFGSTWFIDEGAGFPGFQERKENELMLTGTQGWRMLASPLQTHSIGTLFKDLWLQGFPGADEENGSSNLYFWDEAKRSWTVPSDTTLVPGRGTGFLVYLYSDDDNDGTPEGFPKRLTHSSGMGFSGDHTMNLSYNNTGFVANDGWNLVGNPYPSSIHWNATQGWTRSNMDATMYLWDASANNGNGAYVSWNTLGIGTKGDGKIAPWQGFWVKTHSANPRLAFSDRVKSSGGRLLKQGKQPDQQIPQLTLELKGNELSSKSVVLFHEQATVGADSMDAYKLRSLNTETYLLLGTSADGHQVMDVQALPVSGEMSELELIIEGSDLDGEFTLNWNPEYLPEGWSAELVDTETGESFPLAQAGEHTFRLKGAKAKTVEEQKDLERPVSPITPVLKSKEAPSRFVIRLGQVVSNDTGLDVPTEAGLQQNYPNPFNPATTINYQIPKQSRVRLEVFDMLGRKVATLVDQPQQSPGRYSVRFDASSLSSGMYLYRLQAADKTITKKLTLIK